MKLDIPEIKLKPGQDIFNVTTYPAPGMYIVDDGIMKQLVWFPVGGCVTLAPIPVEMLEQYAAAKERVGVRDKLSEELHGMKGAIDSINVGAGYVSEDVLLKMLAIYQDPALAEKLIK